MKCFSDEEAEPYLADLEYLAPPTGRTLVPGELMGPVAVTGLVACPTCEREFAFAFRIGREHRVSCCRNELLYDTRKHEFFWIGRTSEYLHPAPSDPPF